MVEFAKSELERIPRKEDDTLIAFTNDCTLKIIEYIVSLGMSCNQLDVVMDNVNRIVNGKPLTPLTGEDDEWEPSISGDAIVNKRCYSVKKTPVACFDTEVTRETKDGGLTWQDGKARIVHFPYMPPTRVNRIYYEWIPDDPDNENSGHYIDISNMPNRIFALRERKLNERILKLKNDEQLFKRGQF